MNALKKWQLDQGLSLRNLGLKLGVKGKNTAVNVMRWIKSDRIPSVKYMRIITKVTGITPNEIYQAYYDKNKL